MPLILKYSIQNVEIQLTYKKSVGKYICMV